jgi:hypothetical protein
VLQGALPRLLSSSERGGRIRNGRHQQVVREGASASLALSGLRLNVTAVAKGKSRGLTDASS